MSKIKEIGEIGKLMKLYEVADEQSSFEEDNIVALQNTPLILVTRSYSYLNQDVYEALPRQQSKQIDAFCGPWKKQLTPMSKSTKRLLTTLLMEAL